MPQLIRNPKQEQALSSIVSFLGELKTLNSVLTQNPISFKLSSNGGYKGKLDLNEAMSEKIILILRERRKNLIRSVRSLARENRIELDEKDEKVLSENLLITEENQGPNDSV